MPNANGKTVLGKDGSVVIPEAYREKMGLKGGEVLTLNVGEDGILRIEGLRRAIERAQEIVGKYVPADRSLSED